MNKKIVKISQRLYLKDIPEGKNPNKFANALLDRLINKSIGDEAKKKSFFVKIIDQDIDASFKTFYVLKARLLFKEVTKL